MPTKQVPIKGVTNFRRLTPDQVYSTAGNTLTAVFGNPNFTSPNAPAPPVDEATFKAAYDTLGVANSAAIDGGKKAIAQRNHAKEVVVKYLVLLVHFVEANCKDDMNTFVSSGFTPVSSTKTKTPPVSEMIRKIEPGDKSGEAVITLVKFPGASSYQVQWGVPLAGGALPNSWTSMPVPQVKSATTISGLTPATTYVFQARAVLKAGGYSDWGEPVSRIIV
jgi:hypothetical protein